VLTKFVISMVVVIAGFASAVLLNAVRLPSRVNRGWVLGGLLVLALIIASLPLLDDDDGTAQADRPSPTASVSASPTGPSPSPAYSPSPLATTSVTVVASRSPRTTAPVASTSSAPAGELPVAPALNGPPDRETVAADSVVTLSWWPVPNAKSYVLHFDSDQCKENCFSTEVTGTRYQVTVGFGRYIWYVEGKNTGGVVGPRSESRSIVTVATG
jgi:hypothetical protein